MIIVTGGSGFIGSNIVQALNKEGIVDILVVDHLKDGEKVINLLDLNISDYINKEEFLIQIKADRNFGNIKAIFHEGACSSTTEWDGNYMMNSNYQYSKELLHYSLRRKIAFLYASSAAIYGKRTSNFIESRQYEHPLNVYSYSKFLFDQYVRQVLLEKHSQVVGFRYFNVYGPREGHKGKMASIAFQLNAQLNNGETPKLFEGSDNFKRDFIHVDDVTAVNLWFLKHGISGIFNLGTGRAESFQAVANAVLAYHKTDRIKYIPFPNTLKKYYQTFTQANLINLRTAGYNKPFKTVSEGVTEYMAWLNRNTSI